MAHEITSRDGLVLHKNAAWHGLGTIVQDAPTTREALKLASLDWSVEQWPLSATNGEGEKLAVTNYVANVRTDTKTQLGIVGCDWTPFQNDELADFCDALSSQGNVKVETAGSIRGGQKVWFLLKGDAFDVRNENDVVVPYVLVSNGFDGGTALRCTPTTIRVVCSNTLHMVIPSYDKADLGLRVRGVTKSAYVCRHVGNLKARVEEARKAMETYGKRLQDNRTLIDALSVRDMNSEAVQRFFLECYASQFGAIPANPKTKQEAKARTKAMEAVVACVKRFEKTELPTTGATAWGAFNAYTGWLQHDRKSRLKDAAAARELRLSSNLFGDNSDRSVEAFKVALQLAT